MKKLVIFDLDGTLAESKSPIDLETATLLSRLLEIVSVAIISGGDWPQFQKQVVARLPDDNRMEKLSLLPTCGTKFFRRCGAWKVLYSEDFNADQKAAIIGALNTALDLSEIKIERRWGEIIEDRGSQITFSALGQEAPLDEKRGWDPDFTKRQKIKSFLDSLLPEFSVHLGGSTSIDVTRPGIDKAYGIRKLSETLGIPISAMIFVGDAIFPGGNDYPAKQAGVISIQVHNPDETKRVIETIVACLDSATAGL